MSDPTQLVILTSLKSGRCIMDEWLEEALAALRMAGADVPRYKILEDGTVYFEYAAGNGEKEIDPGVYRAEPRGENH